MTLKILFTGVGRRIELLQAYKQAALRKNIDLKIYGADLTGTAPALAFCDYKRKVCKMTDKEYIGQLLTICFKDSIDLVIPTIDTDLMVLAQNRKLFEDKGIKVLISSPNMIKICRDKNNTAKFFARCGLKAPSTYNELSEFPNQFPCFIKPKDGSSSINAFRVETRDELITYVNQIDDYIIQPFIKGTEYTVDIFCDFEGKPIYITPRIRLAVRSGEVLKTRIRLDDRIIKECQEIIKVFKPCGPLTVQLIRQENTQEDYYIEINPRYGGGVPLSMKAGARSAEVILELLRGNMLDNIAYNISDDCIFSRFDQSVCIQPGDIQHISGVLFDLDDTLYSEKDYVRSGYENVATYLGNTRYVELLWSYFQENKRAIDKLLKEIGRMDEKETVLKIYREHKPKIKLYDGVLELISYLKAKNIYVGVLTDGRVIGQKNKIKALGLDKGLLDDILITDSLGGEQFRKPNDISFRIIQRRWKIPYEEIVYIGDNVNKDFQAPDQLGMQTIYFHNENGLYYNNDEHTRNDMVVRSMSELICYLKSIIDR